jgi:hypothetical protein
MSVYLQFDSLARSNAYIIKNIGGNLRWVPNDNYPNVSPPAYFDPYQIQINAVQSPSRYSVYYKQINSPNNIRTIGFLAHCREKPENLTYSVESCTVVIPASALVKRLDENGQVIYVSVLNEPYLYVKMMPIENSEGNLVYSNNPNAEDATFVVWHDKTQLGETPTGSPAPEPGEAVVRPNSPIGTIQLDTPTWIVYKSCMITVMRLNLESQEWKIRIYDRYGNDLIIAEDDAGGSGYPPDQPPPPPDPTLQTMIIVGIKPNYPL